MENATFPIPRHPELVSGSTGRTMQTTIGQHDIPVALPHSTSACEEKWTLKQVQGDSWCVPVDERRVA